EMPGLVAHGGRTHAHPDRAAVPANEPLFNRVEADIAGNLTAIELVVDIAVVWMGAPLQPPAEQLLARAADDRTDRLVDPQEPPLRIHLHDADGRVLVGRRPAVLLLAQIVPAAVDRIHHAAALGDVLEAVDGADELALRIEQRIDVEQHGNLLAVGALDRHLFVADSLPGPEHLGELGARQLRA